MNADRLPLIRSPGLFAQARPLPYVLLVCFFAQVVLAGPRLSLTADEPVHMAQGYVYWTRRDWRFAWAVAQPPLPDALAGIGLLLQPGPVVEELEGWAGGDHSRFVVAFLQWYGPGTALEAATFVARFPIILVALIGAAFVYRWARERFGRRSGWLALLLFAFDPNLLAHSGLATTDVLLAVWGFVGVYAATRWTTTRSWKWGLLSGTALGLALASKTSGFFPLGIVGLLGFTWAMEEFRRERRIRVWLRWAGRLATLMGLAALTLWALYGFEARPYPFATHLLLWRMLRKHLAEGHTAFLMGQVGQHGWWYYYPVAFLLKTPLPTLFLLGASLTSGRSLRRWWQDRDLWLYPLLYGIATLFSTIAIGYRYLLPALPFLFVITGRIARNTQYAMRRYSALRIPLFLALTWLAFGTVRIFPHYLAFFNELAGGPYGGHRYLVDSNLDWGQSFKALREWMNRYAAEKEPVYISFYTYGEPSLYGITYRSYEWKSPDEGGMPLVYSRFNPPPGLHIISATTLQGVFVGEPDNFDWFRHQEPIARPGVALFVYRVLPRDRQPTWLAQCTVPIAPLTPEAAADGFGRDDLRQVYFDCTSGWFYPTGGRDPGWFALFRPTALSNDPFIRQRLSAAHLSFEQRYTGTLPPFVIYEEAVGAVGPSFTPESPVRVGMLTFLGANLPKTLAVSPGATVEIETWWRVEAVPARPLSVMMHLVGPGGQPVIVSDGLAVPVDQWHPGDIIVQRHRLHIPADAPFGEYRPYTGVYWLDTMERWPVEIDEQPAGDQIPLPVVVVSQRGR